MPFLLPQVGFASAGTREQSLEHQRTLRAARKQCMESLDLTVEDALQHGLQDFSQYGKTKCLPKCLFEKLEIFDETNGFDVDCTTERFFLALVNRKKELIRERAVKCADKKLQSANACEWAHRGLQCFTAKGLTLG